MTEKKPNWAIWNNPEKRIAKLEDAISMSLDREPADGARRDGTEPDHEYLDRWHLVEHLEKSDKLHIHGLKVLYGPRLLGTVDMREFVAVLAREQVPMPAELRAGWQAGQAPAEAETTGKREAKKDTIRAILGAITKLDPEFSSKAMPGQKADFFELCRFHDPKAFKTVGQSTFNDYLDGLCKFRPGARPSNYYQEIAPQIGVKRIKAA